MAGTGSVAAPEAASYAPEAAEKAAADSATTAAATAAAAISLEYEGVAAAAFGEDEEWWLEFGDSVLNRLMACAMDNSHDVLGAWRRIEASQMALKGVRSGYYPTLSVSSGYSYGRASGASGRGAAKSPGAGTGVASLGVDVSWEIDIFGRVARKAAAQKGAYMATRAEAAGTMVSLQGEVASTYFSLLGTEAQRATALSHLQTQREVLGITEARLKAGLSSRLDVSQAKVVVYTTEATLPTLSASIEADIFSLAMLTGLSSEEVREAVKGGHTLPSCGEAMAAVLPRELLSRRPDVVQAQMNFAELAAQLGVAKKEYLPSLTLSGSIATKARRAGDLMSGKSLSYSVGPQLTWTLFDGLSRRYAVAEARAQMEASAEAYMQTVAIAEQEVATAASQYEALLEQTKLLKRVSDESRQALTYSLELYKEGLSDFTNVMDAQVTLLENENSLIASKTDTLTALITLYKALGGGWSGLGGGSGMESLGGLGEQPILNH
jgi:NodT family efflux transporter outer membrane factor (OMF) lipoprotein